MSDQPTNLNTQDLQEEKKVTDVQTENDANTNTDLTRAIQANTNSDEIEAFDANNNGSKVVEGNINNENQSLNQVPNDFININEIGDEAHQTYQSKLVDENKHLLMPDYYDEHNRLRYEEIVAQEEQIRQEIEKQPFVSELFDNTHIQKEFAGSKFEQSILEVCEKYRGVRYIRRDGNYCYLF